MPERYNPDEMSRYGLDPMNMEDCAKWFAYEPEDPDKPVDYSDDPFEFGGIPRQTDSVTTRTAVKTGGTCPAVNHCPILKYVQESAPTGAGEAAVEIASQIIGADLCPGNGYSLETATGAICRAPRRGPDETGKGVANMVNQAFDADQPPA